MKEINISGFGGNEEPKKWWVGVDELMPSATCEAGWADSWYTKKVHTKIGDAFVTFQCDNDNLIQFLNLEEHDKKLKEGYKATMLELMDMDCEDRHSIFGITRFDAILNEYYIDQIREKINKFKEFHVGDEVEWGILGSKGKGVVCKTDDENIHIYRYCKSFINSGSIVPKTEIYGKDGPTYRSMKKTGRHFDDFEKIYKEKFSDE